MNPDKFIEIQHQMKQNQSDVQDFLKDLDSWTEDIKKKEIHPSTQKAQDLPPVRNSLEKKKKKKKKKKPTSSEPLVQEHLIPSRRIKSHDYRSWDKFDVDKALNEVDKEGNEEESEGSETDEEWEEERSKRKAELLKDQGNQLFKEGKYNEAIECYTHGIACDSENALLPANRAMALIKGEKFASAEKDCSVAIVLDPTYVKAYSRRGTSRIGLKHYEEAQSDFQKVLSLEPHNKQAKAELEKLHKLMNPPPTSVEVSDAGIVKPIHIPRSKRSKKPLRRLVVEEIGVGENEARAASVARTVANQSQGKHDITARDEQSFKQFVSPADIDTMPASNGVQDNRTNNLMDEESTQIEIGSDNNAKSRIQEIPSQNNCDTTTKASSSKVNVIEKSSKSGEASSISSAKSEASTKTRSVGASQHSPVVSPESSPRIPGVPANSYQFQTDWKTLRHHPDKFYQYLKEIEPSSYVKLFGEALELDMLMGLMNVLQDYYVPRSQDVLLVLQCMTKVKRFDMTVMFMSTKEKQVIQDLFTYVRTKGSHSEGDVNACAKKYGIRS